MFFFVFIFISISSDFRQIYNEDDVEVMKEADNSGGCLVSSLSEINTDLPTSTATVFNKSRLSKNDGQ